jgi:hypothetical protein
MNRITIKQLLELGFKEMYEKVQEKEFSYECHLFEKNDSTLDVTTEYDLNGKVQHQYTCFNGEHLKGKEITLKLLKLLIEIM